MMETEDKQEQSSDEEEIFVYVKFDDFTDDYSKTDLTESKFLGLETDEPILQLGNKVFGGRWKDTIGTAVFYEEAEPTLKKCYFTENVAKPLKYSLKTQKSLHMKRVFISKKKSSTKEGPLYSVDNDESKNRSTIEKDTDEIGDDVR